MAFTIKDSTGSTLLTAISPLNCYSTGLYYCKTASPDSVTRKITIDSSPSVDGSFAQDFGNASWKISGGTLILIDTSFSNIHLTFEGFAALIKHQIGLTLLIPSEGGVGVDGTFNNCVCTAFELMRRPSGHTVIQNGDGATARAVIAMEFVQLSQ